MERLGGGGEGEAVNVAFVYKHKMTSEVLVVDIDRARELDAARGHWQLIHSVNAVETLAFIVSLTPKQRNKYIKQLTE
jgi:spermidine synthase